MVDFFQLRLSPLRQLSGIIPGGPLMFWMQGGNAQLEQGRVLLQHPHKSLRPIKSNREGKHFKSLPKVQRPCKFKGGYRGCAD